MSTLEDQLNKVRTQKGFIAALDQSGGSTPKALRIYGVSEDAYSNEEEMFALVHEMRSRIVTSPAFGGDRILGGARRRWRAGREHDLALHLRRPAQKASAQSLHHPLRPHRRTIVGPAIYPS